jgi:serine kinase of HPr protein (carbohydrate metabolism regulator)
MPALVHGTAVVIGTTGLIVVGPSGSGKTSIALRLVAEARREGHFAAFVSDDQVLVELVNGRLVATAPPTIKGMVELRGSGIGRVETIEHAVLAFALEPVVADAAHRIPEENQYWAPIRDVSLPLHFIDSAVADPFTQLVALMPGFPIGVQS